MEVFRISREKYANTLSASGAANRWNIKGQFVIYAGSSRSLSSLEMVVHRSAIQPKATYKVMVIHLKDQDDLFHQIKTNELPENWRSIAAYAVQQKMGAEWYLNQTSLVLKVPSVIIPQEFNVVINTMHPEFSKNVQLVELESYFWDERLL